MRTSAPTVINLDDINIEGNDEWNIDFFKGSDQGDEGKQASNLHKRSCRIMPLTNQLRPELTWMIRSFSSYFSSLVLMSLMKLSDQDAAMATAT